MFPSSYFSSSRRSHSIALVPEKTQQPVVPRRLSASTHHYSTMMTSASSAAAGRLRALSVVSLALTTVVLMMSPPGIQSFDIELGSVHAMLPHRHRWWPWNLRQPLQPVLPHNYRYGKPERMHHVEPETLKQAEAPTEPGSLREPEILIKEPGKSGEPKKLTDSSATKQQPQESQRLGTELQIQTEEPESMEPEPSANNMESMEPKQDSRLISAAKRFVVDDRFHEIGSAASSSQRGFLPWWPAASIRRRRPGPMPAPTDPEWAKRRALVKRRFVVRAPFASRNRNELAAEGDEEPEVAERRAMLQQRLARLYRHMFSKGSAKRDLESAHRAIGDRATPAVIAKKQPSQEAAGRFSPYSLKQFFVLRK